MSIKKIEIQDHQGNVYHPHTTSDVVFMPDGRKTSDVINNSQNHKLTQDSGYALSLPAKYDINNTRKSGIYMGSDLVNAPSVLWYIIDVKAHNDKYVLQEATSFTEVNTPKLSRALVNNVWTPWRSL